MRLSLRWGLGLLILLFAVCLGCVAADTNAESSEPFVGPAKKSKERLPCGGARLLFLFLSHATRKDITQET